MLKLLLSALLFSGTVVLAAAAQETGPGLQVPNMASVTPAGPQQLVPGQDFDFLLSFDRAPAGYGGGEILCRFRMTPPALETHPINADWEPQQTEVTRTGLIDGEAMYHLSLTITEVMGRGKWRLVEVTLGRGSRKSIPIPDNVTFEVHDSPQLKAVVTATKFQRLETGQKFDFELTFETPPLGYINGRVRYRFQMPGTVSTYGPLNGRRAGPSGEAPLVNGQATYKLSLPVDGSMQSGKWELAEVDVEQLFPKPVLTSGDVTFEVHRTTAMVLQIQAPKSARAGQRFDFKVSVAQYPVGLGLSSTCVLQLAADLRPVLPGGRDDSNFPSVSVSSTALDPTQQSYEMSGFFAPDLPSGPWQRAVKIHAEPPAAERDGGLCRSSRLPPIEGEAQFTFIVEPSPGLVTPTSVAVVVNPSQVQLLFAEADRLKAEARHLKQQLTSENMAAHPALLQSSVRGALDGLVKTEAAYKERGADRTSARVVNAFFDDIRFEYGEALRALAGGSAQLSQTGPRLERVVAPLGGSSPRLDRASGAVLASILHNARAYGVVASLKLMTFNLDVFSEPKGATISYRQRGEEYHSLDHETDWRIENLARAVYSIRLQKAGYEDKEVTFDAIDSTSTSIDIQLEKKRGAR